MRRVAPLALVFGVGVVTTLAAVSALHGANIPGFGAPGTQLVLTRLSTPAPGTPASARPNFISKPAALVSKSIVSIYTESKPIAVDNGVDSDPFFRRFFGDQWWWHAADHNVNAASDQASLSAKTATS